MPAIAAAALVSNGLDYANSVLSSSPVQSSLPTAVTQQTSLASLAVVQKLHFLPSSMAHDVLRSSTQSYLAELLNPYVLPRTLRSSFSANLHVPRINLSFGSRSFYTAAPVIWNFLPSSFYLSQTLDYF